MELMGIGEYKASLSLELNLAAKTKIHSILLMRSMRNTDHSQENSSAN
jgi:hypothetical protein